MIKNKGGVHPGYFFCSDMPGHVTLVSCRMPFYQVRFCCPEKPPSAVTADAHMLLFHLRLHHYSLSIMTNVASINCCQAPHTTVMTHLKKKNNIFEASAGTVIGQRTSIKSIKKNVHVNAGGDNAWLLNGYLKHKTSAHLLSELWPYCFL